MLAEKTKDLEKKMFPAGSASKRWPRSNDKFLKGVSYCLVSSRKDPSILWLEIGPMFERKFGGATAWVLREGSFVNTIIEEEDAPEEIVQAIEVSKSILKLKDDWDGEGSPGYSEMTWDRMRRFLLGHAQAMRNQFAISIPAPQILPGPDGSIDMLWKTDDYELLVNIPSDPNSFASFYGDDRDRSSVKGTIDPARTNQGILSWLMTHQ